MTEIMKNKNILIMGLRNKWSIAWGITKKLYEEGAQLAFTYQGEREKDGVLSLLSELEHEKDQNENKFIVMECNAGSDHEIDAVFGRLEQEWGRLDGVVHAVAHAKSEDIKNDFIYTSREGFAHALDISAYSLVYVSKKASEMMPEGGSIVTLTYMGSQRVFPGYNVMGVAKAALESCVRYLAANLGEKGIRVNAISSGPIKTISSKAVKDFASILSVVDEKAPLKRGVDADEVGGTALYLLSSLSSAVTGEIHYVDCGFNIMGV